MIEFCEKCKKAFTVKFSPKETPLLDYLSSKNKEEYLDGFKKRQEQESNAIQEINKMDCTCGKFNVVFVAEEIS